MSNSIFSIISITGLVVSIMLHVYMAFFAVVYLPRSLLMANPHYPTVSSTMDDSTLRSAVRSWLQDPATTCATYGHISQWDTSAVTDFSRLFYNATEFNETLNGWNVSRARNMSAMFEGASSFQQDLDQWNVSTVLDFSRMFAHAKSFHGNLSTWVVTGAFDLSFMFYHATMYNGDISSWTVEIEQKGFQLRYAQSMESMFHGAVSFQGDVSEWDTSVVINMKSMFQDAIRFNSDLSKWNVALVGDMSKMFQNASSFDQKLCWSINPERVNTTDMFKYSMGEISLLRENCPGYGDTEKVAGLGDSSGYRDAPRADFAFIFTTTFLILMFALNPF